MADEEEGNAAASLSGAERVSSQSCGLPLPQGRETSLEKQGELP